jgi:pilus assembly protein FimV
MNFERLLTGLLGVEMFAKLPRLILMACVLAPSLSWAIGLGEIHLNSALNEPLNAEIALVAATPEELGSLRAVLASRDTFTRYGIDRPPFLSTIAFKVGHSKDGRDALLVTSTEAIPEPFVTFLVEVNWARGRLVREYTVLLDPPVYTPGEAKASAPAVAAPVATAAESAKSGSIQRENAAASAPAPAASAPAAGEEPAPSAPAAGGAALNSYTVRRGDTLTKVARSLNPGSAAQVDQTMIAIFRSNPQAFDGNINLLRRGAVLRVPGADEIAALKQREAISEVHKQMSAWRGVERPRGDGHLRLVTPSGGPSAGGHPNDNAANSEAAALKGRVQDLESQLSESRRLLEIKNRELADLQRKLAVAAPAAAPSAKPAVPAEKPVEKPAEKPPIAATPPEMRPEQPPAAGTPAAGTPAAEATPPASAAAPTEAPSPPKPAVAMHKPAKPAAQPEETSGSWLDWITENWWMPAAGVGVLVLGLGFAAWKRRRSSEASDFGSLTDTDIAESHDSTSKLLGVKRADESFVVEESGQHERPDFKMPVEPAPAPAAKAGAREPKPSEDTLSSETAINLDQGDPLAEADFHMAYGLYDQAADLVRIALEREPDRRDLKLKLLEIYFVWGNKDLFLQTAKELDAAKDRAPAGEWEKIVIMGKQICPDAPMFAKSVGSGMGAGALVDLNLEGGENRVDIDLFGEPEGEQSHVREAAHATDATADTSESPSFAPAANLDFVLDAPERGSDDLSPTREMPPAREEPTVESEAMHFGEASLSGDGGDTQQD